MQKRYDLGINFILDTKQSRFHNFFIVLWMTGAQPAYKMVTVSITKTVQWSIKTTVHMNE